MAPDPFLSFLSFPCKDEMSCAASASSTDVVLIGLTLASLKMGMYLAGIFISFLQIFGPSIGAYPASLCVKYVSRFLLCGSSFSFQKTQEWQSQTAGTPTSALVSNPTPLTASALWVCTRLTYVSHPGTALLLGRIGRFF
jgi:hypothetical protein